jgi:bifunctional non-homologous end joining protein LigD
MLKEYHKRRNFSKTPEPDGNTMEQSKSDAHGSHSPLRFVVQKHDASRLHYDFRLETEEGVLKSWAIPKGISLDPKVRRLAILTEDHPLDYLLFEGIIPEGNYGAGTVVVWDTGTYNTSKEGHKETISDQFEKGKIVFNLLGHKLRGRFSLVKTSSERENQWLLIKVNDEFVSDEDLTISRPESVLTKMTNNELVLESESNKKQRKKSKAKNKMTTRAARISSIHLQSKGASKRKNKSDLELSDIPVSGFPTKIKPMLAMPIDKPFNSENWVFEIKWDGVRSILFFNRTKSILEMLSRSGNSITLRYPELINHIRSAVKCNDSAVIDGEIVILNKEGIPDFQSHQTRMNVNDNKEIANLSAEIPGTYYLFDILYLDGKNLQNLDYLERREILSKVIETNSRVRISDYFEGKHGIDIFDAAKRMNLEGIIAKNKFSKYLQGARSRDWLKIKNIRTQDCVVIGYIRGEGNREAYFGSLLLAVYNNVGSSDDGTNGSKLRFVGHTGSGFNFDQLYKIYNKLKQMKIEKCPVDYIPYTNRDPTWVRPDLVAEIKFNHWTNEGIMRAPIFLRFREDKNPNECTILSEKHIEDVVPSANDKKEEDDKLAQPRLPKTIPRYATTTRTTIPDTAVVEEQKLSSSSSNKFSNLGKVYWDKTSEHPEFTKRNLLDYYDKISVHILHYLKDRPISLSRYPDGIKGKHFYHKHWDQKKPEYVKTVQVYSESRNDKINYLVCNNKETLLWIANLGCIEMHPWYSRVNDFSACKEGSVLVEDKCGLDFPDFIVFDLDPYIYSGAESKGTEPEYNVKGFKAAVDVAYYLKELFDQLKIKSYVKTSGKTGLHIFVPIKNSYSFSLTRKFAETIGKMLLTRYPQKITMEWDTRKRKGKVFFDHNQNARGKTIASIFSARPTISATISMPLRWEKLQSIVPTDFTILNVPDVIRKTGDAWKDILDKKQDLLEIFETTE